MKLEADNIFFRYDNGNREILNRFSVMLEGGNKLGIMAPSGFGKTTLCKILAGYEESQSGQVLLDGKPLGHYKGRCPVQMIWQHPEQSIDPRWRLKKVLKEANIEDKTLIARLGIREEWMERFPSELSGGELQRFCIARALGVGTEILLADEITTMLDLVTQSEIWHAVLGEVERRKMGLLVVSHSEELLKQVCDRILNLEREVTYGY